jgi:hypothetical protein
VRKAWEEMGRKIPDAPDHGAGRSGRATSSFFGDPVSPRAVFAIDISSSMRETATVRAGRDAGATRPKVDIVKGELGRALDGLRASSRFNIIGYNASLFPWRGGGTTTVGAPSRTALRLHAASADALRSAGEFAANLPVAAGTNIHDALAAAIAVPEVETVYLLSDGAPSRGGGPAEIERRVAAMNYLAGVRIVTYGFAAEGKGAYDEVLMKRLAGRNWGWYRKLN